MRISSICLALFVTAAMLFVATPVGAVPMPLFTFSGLQPSASTFGSFNIGNEFQTDEELDVFAIGAYIHADQISLGLTTIDYSGLLYSGTDLTTPLLTVAIPAGTAVDSQNFAYAPLSTTLDPGANYVVTSMSGVTGQSAFSYNSTGASAGTWGFGTTLIQDRFASSFGLNLVSSNVSFEEFLGGNLLVDFVPPPVPEPSTALMCLVALPVGHAIRRRRRRRVAA